MGVTTGLLLSILPMLPGGDLLLEEDFQQDLDGQWIVFGDPTPFIVDALGDQPPSFCNNGDNLYTSGVVSREVFTTAGGLILEADVYLECDERGAWVSTQLGFVRPEYIDGDDPNEQQIVQASLSYLGELNWMRPHLGTVIRIVGHPEGERFFREYFHADSLLGGWHNLTIRLNGNGIMDWLLDDELLCSSPSPLPAETDSVRVIIGGRSSDWGVALHDNIELRRP